MALHPAVTETDEDNSSNILKTSKQKQGFWQEQTPTLHEHFEDRE